MQKQSKDTDDSGDSIVEPITVINLNKKLSAAEVHNSSQHVLTSKTIASKELSNFNFNLNCTEMYTPRDDGDRLAAITLTKVTSSQEKICHLLDDIR